MGTVRRLGVAGFALVLLASCGGGGSGESTPPATAREAAQATSIPAAEAEPSAGWLWLANEGSAFTIDGPRTVRFGQGDKWVELEIDGTGRCTNAAFGRDPARGTLKRCYVQAADAGPDRAPTVYIRSPARGARFKAGDVITFSGLAFDREEGWLADGTLFTWSAELHHDGHSHPFLPETQGTGGKVTLPVRGETSADIFYRFTLRATDTAGHGTTITRDIAPRTTTMRFATEPAGLAITLDGQPLAAPASVVGVVGAERDLAAADQIAGGRRYRFDHWNDGGAAAHTLSTPTADTSYIATFSDIGSAVNQPPTVSLDAAASGTTDLPMVLTALAADGDGRIASVTFYDGTSQIGEVQASPYTFTWTPRTTGTHSLSAQAVDNDGATTRSAALAVAVRAPTPLDTTAPQAALTSPAPLATGLVGTITLAATASDNVGVQRVEFEVDGASVGAAVTAAPYRLALDTAAYSAGQHVVRMRARDAAGNTSGWSAATVLFGGDRSEPAGFTRQDNWISDVGPVSTFTQTPDGRFLIAEQRGNLRVVKGGVLQTAPMLSVDVDKNGERGLLGIALHPQFASNGYLYIYYTSKEGGSHNRISRFVATGDTTTGVETVLVDLPMLSTARNHNGGAMHFGVDGKLYVGVGENAQPLDAQDLSTPMGKLLRFNDDGSIPADNPFATTQSGLGRAVWAYGLRNPFTFAVQPGTGRIHINDVGQDAWEEINLGAPGANYGWPASEGRDHLETGMTGPLFTYPHDEASLAGAPNPAGFLAGFCIVGGAFYPVGGNFPASYRGNYFFADFVSQFVARVDLANGNAAYAFASLPGLPVDLLIGADGALYVLMRTSITRFAAR